MSYTEDDYGHEAGQAIEDARRRVFLEFIQKATTVEDLRTALDVLSKGALGAGVCLGRQKITDNTPHLVHEMDAAAQLEARNWPDLNYAEVAEGLQQWFNATGKRKYGQPVIEADEPDEHIPDSEVIEEDEHPDVIKAMDEAAEVIQDETEI